MEDTKYAECPDCGGDGETMDVRLYPSGHSEIWVTCELCKGEGKVLESDLLFWKLRGWF